MRRAVFTLPDLRRVHGASLGATASRRRGRSHDVAGSRAYLPGDDVRAVDWAASARATAARGDASFVVREHFAEEAPVVALCVERTPAMGWHQHGPLLRRPAALRETALLVAASAAAGRSPFCYLGEHEGAWVLARPGARGPAARLASEWTRDG